MKKETRQEISRCSQQIDNLEATIELIKTSTVLCFTTMDRGPEETVSIESVTSPTGEMRDTNIIISDAKESMIKYLEWKISELEEKIDEITRKDA